MYCLFFSRCGERVNAHFVFLKRFRCPNFGCVPNKLAMTTYIQNLAKTFQSYNWLSRDLCIISIYS